MFGSKEIIGEETVKLIDGRIFKLPSFTGVDKNDKLFLVRLGEDLALFNSDSYSNIIQELEFKFHETEDISERLRLRKLVKMFYYSIIRELKCGRNRMLTIPKDIPSEYKINCEKIKCIGERKHLIIKKEKNN